MKIGTLERIRIREVWPGEESDFTPWLCQNIELINDAVGLELDPDKLQRETPVGRYRLDIFGSSGDDTVIIENQYGKTDHSHLGQLITYAATLEADVAVWICERPQPEHVQAINWLNESADTRFYLLKVELFTIDGSPPAPLLTVIVGPSEDLRAAGDVKRKLADEGRQAAGYWRRLLELGKQIPGFDWKNAGTQSDWMTKTAVSGQGVQYALSNRKSERLLELLAGRKDSENWNQQLVDHLYNATRQELADSFPEHRLERTQKIGTNQAKIVVHLSGASFDDDGIVNEDHARDHAEQMARFELIIDPHLDAAVAAADAAEQAEVKRAEIDHAEAEEAAEQRDALEPLPAS